MSGSSGYGTGHGTTLTFAQLGSYAVRSITLQTESGPSPDISHLGSNSGAPGGARTYIPPDLTDVGPFTAEILFDSDHTTALPAIATSDTITVTLPIRVSGNTTNATVSGTGWIVSQDWGNLQSNVEQLAPVQIQFSTRPTWSAEAA